VYILQAGVQPDEFWPQGLSQVVGLLAELLNLALIPSAAGILDLITKVGELAICGDLRLVSADDFHDFRSVGLGRLEYGLLGLDGRRQGAENREAAGDLACHECSFQAGTYGYPALTCVALAPPSRPTRNAAVRPG